MALRESTGSRNLRGGKLAVIRAIRVGATMAFVDGGTGADTITDSGNGFVTAGFVPGQCEVFGATSSGNNTTYTITAVAAGTLTFPTGSFGTAEAFGAGTVIVQATGGSLRDVYKDGIIDVYAGFPPATADAAVTSYSKLCRITVASGAFVAGSYANGLELGPAASGVLAKDDDVWSGTNLTSGIASFFRWKANTADDDTLSTVYARIQGDIATSNAELVMANTSLTSGATTTIDSWSVTLPAS